MVQRPVASTEEISSLSRKYITEASDLLPDLDSMKPESYFEDLAEPYLSMSYRSQRIRWFAFPYEGVRRLKKVDCPVHESPFQDSFHIYIHHQNTRDDEKKSEHLKRTKKSQAKRFKLALAFLARKLARG
jgi:hypothetical protein